MYHALIVKGLNVSDFYCPGQLDLSPWPHLSGLQLLNASVDVNEASVLVDQDVPPVHIALDYCWGRQSTESAIRNEDPLRMVRSRANWWKGV